MEDLGGARVHTEISGNAHFYADSEAECFEQIKKLVTFIPWNNRKKADPYPPKPPRAGRDVEKIIPTENNRPYDVRDVIKAYFDKKLPRRAPPQLLARTPEPPAEKPSIDAAESESADTER